jgi:anti-sigma-K factor RskA
MNLLQPDRLRALSREHALGTLHGGARRRFERLLHESGAARQELARWQEHFAALAAAVPPLQPREQVWAGLQQRLGFAAATPAAAAPAGWRRWLDSRTWGGALAGALAAVVMSTVLLQANPGWIGQEPIRDGLPASYVGLLSNAAQRPALLLSSRRQGRVLTAKLLLPLPAQAGRVATLWAFPKDGKPPFKVGTITATSGSVTLPLPQPAEQLFFTVDRLGVSFEPTGPDGTEPTAPSGELVLAGPCVKLW